MHCPGNRRFSSTSAALQPVYKPAYHSSALRLDGLEFYYRISWHTSQDAGQSNLANTRGALGAGLQVLDK
ncbi:hypothetical protein BDV11DRAFT_115747 [Aspergillus similis]